MIIKYDTAEDSVKQLNRESESHYYWDGWTICKFQPDPVAIWSKDGAYNRYFGWGIETRYNVDKDGSWRIDS